MLVHTPTKKKKSHVVLHRRHTELIIAKGQWRYIFKSKLEYKYGIILDPKVSYSTSLLASITTTVITFPPTAVWPAKYKQRVQRL